MHGGGLPARLDAAAGSAYMTSMEEPSERPGFFVRTFIRPFLTPERLARSLPGQDGESLLMTLARTGRITWVAPEVLTDEVLNKREGVLSQTPLGMSMSRHPDKTPSRWMTSKNLLEWDGELNRSRLDAAFDYKTLDRLEITMDFAKDSGAMREEIARKVTYNEGQLALPGEQRNLRPYSFDLVEADNYYRERIDGGKRWLARLDKVFPPPTAAQEKASTVAVETPSAPALRQTRDDLPAVPHLPKIHVPAGAQLDGGRAEGR